MWSLYPKQAFVCEFSDCAHEQFLHPIFILLNWVFKRRGPLTLQGHVYLIWKVSCNPLKTENMVGNLSLTFPRRFLDVSLTFPWPFLNRWKQWHCPPNRWSYRYFLNYELFKGLFFKGWSLEKMRGARRPELFWTIAVLNANEKYDNRPNGNRNPKIK